MAWCCQAISHCLNNCLSRCAMLDVGIYCDNFKCVKCKHIFSDSYLDHFEHTGECYGVSPKIHWHTLTQYLNGLVQDCSISIANELEILQSCTKPYSCNVVLPPGPRFNIKMTSYQYRKFHCGDKTILRPSYLHIGISYTDKTTSLYWIRALPTSHYPNKPMLTKFH